MLSVLAPPRYRSHPPQGQCPGRSSALRLSQGRQRLIEYALLSLLMLWGQAQAEPPNSNGQKTSVELRWAIAQSLQYNPRLQAYPWHIKAMEADIIQADLGPNPSLQLAVDNALGNGEKTGFDAAEISLRLSQVIELGNKRQARLAFANAQVKLEQNAYELARLDVLSQTARHYYQLLLQQALLELVADRISQEQQALKIIRNRAQAGAVGNADVAKMKLRLARSEALQLTLRSRHQLARQQLAAMWLGEANFERAQGQLSQPVPIPSKEQLLTALEKSPVLFRQAALQEVAKAQLSNAQAEGKINLESSIGLRQFQESDAQALFFSLSAPLSLSNPNRGGITRARVNQQLSHQQSQWQTEQLRLNLLIQHQQLLSIEQQIQRISEQLLPSAKLLLHETQRGYQKGRYSVLQWVDAQTELFSLEQQRLEYQLQLHNQFLQLEKLTGQPLASGAAL